MTVQNVVVVGGGIMGSGIAQVVAHAGFEVAMVDVSAAALDRAAKRIERGLARAVKFGGVSQEEADAAYARISLSSDLGTAAASADHAIETVIEDLDVKRDVLAQLDAACREEVIISSNTSQFSISTLAAATSRPDRVIGGHWFNPPPVMDLIEIIRGIETSDVTLATTLELAGRYGKQTVVCDKDTPGSSPRA